MDQDRSEMPTNRSGEKPDVHDVTDTRARAELDMPMPSAPVPPLDPLEADGARETTKAPPAGIGRQAAQLVLIPAVITLICVGFFFMFGALFRPDSIENQLSRLRQSSGGGRGPFGFQDPRYKDRGLAAANIAHRLPKITDPAQRASLSNELIDILQNHVGPEEDELHVYLLLAIGQLGQELGLKAILSHCDSERTKVLEGAVGGLLSWVRTQTDRRGGRRAAKQGSAGDDDAVRTARENAERLRIMGVEQGLPKLIQILGKGTPVVKAEAAAALGALAERGDPEVIAALKEAMSAIGVDQREVRWNSAIALAKLGDKRGSRIVTELLLNREALGELPAAEGGRGAMEKMNLAMQDRIILSTLAAAHEMTDPLVRDKIRQIADNDPNRAVRAASKSLLMDLQRIEGSTTPDPEGGAPPDSRVRQGQTTGAD